MDTNSNMLLNNTHVCGIKNKGFSLLDKMLKDNGWNLTHNELNYLNYVKPGDETSFINIKILTDKITVSLPIKNSPYQFVTSFKSYYEASEYIEQKILDYI